MVELGILPRDETEANFECLRNIIEDLQEQIKNMQWEVVDQDSKDFETNCEYKMRAVDGGLGPEGWYYLTGMSKQRLLFIHRDWPIEVRAASKHLYDGDDSQGFNGRAELYKRCSQLTPAGP